MTPLRIGVVGLHYAAGTRRWRHASFGAGKHVLCEAPLARSAGEGLAMTDAARAAGRVAVVDMQSRFWPGLAELRRQVADGWIGCVDNVAVTAFYPDVHEPRGRPRLGLVRRRRPRGELAAGPRPADRRPPAVGVRRPRRRSRAGGAPGTDLAGPDGPLPADSVDSAAWTARTADGALCSVPTSWVAPAGAGWRLVAHGSEGVLIARGRRAHRALPRAAVRGPDRRGGHGDRGRRRCRHRALHPARRRAGRARGRGEPAGDLPTFADGVAALRIADAVDGG